MREAGPQRRGRAGGHEEELKFVTSTVRLPCSGMKSHLAGEVAQAEHQQVEETCAPERTSFGKAASMKMYSVAKKLPHSAVRCTCTKMIII